MDSGWIFHGGSGLEGLLERSSRCKPFRNLFFAVLARNQPDGRKTFFDPSLDSSTMLEVANSFPRSPWAVLCDVFLGLRLLCLAGKALFGRPDLPGVVFIWGTAPFERNTLFLRIADPHQLVVACLAAVLVFDHIMEACESRLLKTAHDDRLDKAPSPLGFRQ